MINLLGSELNHMHQAIMGACLCFGARVLRMAKKATDGEFDSRKVVFDCPFTVKLMNYQTTLRTKSRPAETPGHLQTLPLVDSADNDASLCITRLSKLVCQPSSTNSGTLDYT